MPTYSIPGPDGKTYSIDGPAGQSRDQVIAAIERRKQSQPQTGTAEVAPSTMGDVASSFGRGIVKGSAALAGGTGDLREMAEGHPWAQAALSSVPIIGTLSKVAPSSKQIMGGVEKVAGPLGQPETTAGKYAQSVGEFVPSAVIGEGGLLTRAATTIAGGLGAEAGGEIAGEPGRIIGGLIGGGGAGLATAEGQAMRLSGRLPTADQIRDSAQAAYRQVENTRLIASEGSLNGLVSATRAGLDQRLLTDVAPRTMRAMDQLEESGGDIAGIMRACIRQRLGEIRPSEGSDWEAAQHVRDSIDNYIETLPDTEIVQGGPGGQQFTQAMLNHARSSWRAYSKAGSGSYGTGNRQPPRAAVSGTGANSQMQCANVFGRF